MGEERNTATDLFEKMIQALHQAESTAAKQQRYIFSLERRIDDIEYFLETSLGTTWQRFRAAMEND